MAGCGKKMAKSGMMKEEKMMKREGRGMAKADMQKMMAKGGMAKKKMAKGGSVKKGCDGVATKGKTKGMMV